MLTTRIRTERWSPPVDERSLLGESLFALGGGVAGALYMIGTLGGDPPLGVHLWSALPRTLAFVVFFLAITVILFFVAVLVTAPPGASPATPANEPRAGASAPELRPTAALDYDENRIRVRLEEIAKQRHQIESVQQMVRRQKPGAALAVVREKLAHAESVLDGQQSRHHAQLWVISLARWQEQLAQFTRGAVAPVFGSGNSRLEELASITGAGEGLLAEWRADLRTAVTREGARCLSHLQELLGRCAQLQEGIVVQEAMLAIRGIDPTENVERTAALSIEPLESLQTDLGEGGSLAAALIELELEHERLREDDQDARNVERFLGDLEGGRA